MIIVFGNQKGGVGKTTLATEFANYIAEQGYNVTVVDVDFQQNLLRNREKDRSLYEEEPLYEVIAATSAQIAEFMKGVEGATGHLIIDFPGRMDDPNLLPIINKADIVVVPFRYDQNTLESTGAFIKYIEYAKTKAKIFFVPNRIKGSVNYRISENADVKLKQFGELTPQINDVVAFERIDTLRQNPAAIERAKPVFDLIIDRGGLKKQ